MTLYMSPYDICYIMLHYDIVKASAQHGADGYNIRLARVVIIIITVTVIIVIVIVIIVIMNSSSSSNE